MSPAILDPEQRPMDKSTPESCAHPFEQALSGGLRKVHHCPQCGSLLIGVPVLKCAHCGSQMPLRAFVYNPEPGLYIAECIDLDILSQGKSPEEAVSKLQEAMFSYLAAAFDGTSTKGLVPRPSPLSHRLRYHWHHLVNRVKGFFLGRHNKHLMPCGSDAQNVRFSHF
jgi:predicted RNase H-like HicB family nuclease